MAAIPGPSISVLAPSAPPPHEAAALPGGMPPIPADEPISHGPTISMKSVNLGLTAIALITVICPRCATHPTSAAWMGKIDTLPNGAIRVSNMAGQVWKSGEAWRLEQYLRIGDAVGKGPDAFGAIAAIAVDAAGKVYVLDRMASEIRVFDSMGTYVRTLAHKGSGPGEIDNPNGMAWDRRGRLWVVDPGNSRFLRFDTAGRFIGGDSRTVFFNSWPWRGGFDSSGSLLDQVSRLGPPPQGQVLVRFDSALRAIDTIALPEHNPIRFEFQRAGVWTWAAVPFTPNLIWRIDRRAYLWFGVTAPYRIYQRRLTGDTVRIIERSYVPLPVTASEKDSALASLAWFTRQGGTVDRSRIPDAKPAFNVFFFDDEDDLWVEPAIGENLEGSGFDVFDRTGRYLGRATADFTVAPWPTPVFQSHRIYAVTTDESGVPYVVVARLVRGRQH